MSFETVLKCAVKEYNMMFGAFKSGELDAWERCFDATMRAIRRCDLATCCELAAAGAGKEDLVRGMMEGYAGLFESLKVADDLANLRVVAQFHLGQNRLFVWGMDPKPGERPGPLRRPLRLAARDQCVWDPSPADALSLLLAEILQRGAESPGEYGPAVVGTVDWEYEVPGTSPGQPVYVQFSGKAYDVDVLAAQVGPEPEDDEVLSFYRAAWQAFRDGRVDALGEFYTEKSRSKYLEWVAKMSSEQRAAYHRDAVAAGRRVVFIVEADPGYVVCYRLRKGDGSPGELIRYDYVVRDAMSSNQLRLTNFYVGCHLDTFLNDPTLFRGSILVRAMEDSRKKAAAASK